MADDRALLRAILRTIVTAAPDFDLVGEATDSREALTMARRSSPDVVLLDLELPQVGGVETTGRLKQDAPGLRIVILAEREDDDIEAAMAAGASAFVLPGVGPGELVEIIRGVAEREPRSRERDHRGSTVAVLAEAADAGWADAAGSIRVPLSARELEVLEHVALGMSNRAISSALAISEQTVKNHIGSILRKTGVKDRTQAVLLAIRHGWIALPGG